MNQERRIRKLTQLNSDEQGIVAKVKLSEMETTRLNQLGLHIGSSIRVLTGHANNCILVAIGDSRIGINFEIAQKIYVY